MIILANVAYIFSIFLIILVIYGYKFILQKLSNNVLKKESYCDITVLIPVYNGEYRIANKIKNVLDSDYPVNMMKVVVIDDGSTDNTSKIAEQYPVSLINTVKRVGKIGALNQGIKKSNSDVIIITDSDVMTKKNSFKELVAYFSDEKVAGVVGNVQMAFYPQWFAFGESRFLKNENTLRYLESRADSVSCMDGRLCAFRKSVIPAINNSSAADDVELPFQIRKSGHRVVFAKEAEVYEEPTCLWRSWFTQKRGRSARGISVTLRHMDFLFNPKYGLFGFFIFPVRRIIFALVPFFLIYVFIYTIWLWPSVIMAVGVLVALLLLRLKNRSLFLYIILLNTALILSWLDLAAGKINKGAKWENY